MSRAARYRVDQVSKINQTQQRIGFTALAQYLDLFIRRSTRYEFINPVTTQNALGQTKNNFQFLLI